MALTIKFLGSFRQFSGKSCLRLAIQESLTVRELIWKLVDTYPALRNTLIDPELGDPRPNSLILVNGKEISVLNGLDTLLKEGDEIVFIPVLHGG